MVFHSGRFRIGIYQRSMCMSNYWQMSWEKEKLLILLSLFSLKSECLNSILIWLWETIDRICEATGVNGSVVSTCSRWWFNRSSLNLRCRPDLKTFPTCLSKLALPKDQLPSEKRQHSYTVRNISPRFLKLLK